jgi:tryptophan-rich sensory protein
MQNKVAFAACIAAGFLPGVVGSLTTGRTPKDAEWYVRSKPAFTPPSWVFPVVWPILYLCIGIALYLAWSRGLGGDVVALFALNLLFNALWSPLFFRYQMFSAALAMVAGMIVTVVMIMFMFATRARGKYRTRGLALLAPYLAWLSFAFLLNAAFIRNSQGPTVGTHDWHSHVGIMAS